MRIFLWRSNSWISRKSFPTWLSRIVAAEWRNPCAVISPTPRALQAARSRKLNARLENGAPNILQTQTATPRRRFRRELIQQQYDEMVKAAVALKRDTATAEAILKRYNSYNVRTQPPRRWLKW